MKGRSHDIGKIPLSILEGRFPVDFAQALGEVGIELSWDMRASRPMIRDAGETAWQHVDDMSSADLRYRIATSCMMPDKQGRLVPALFGQAEFFALRDAHMHNACHDPFLEYLHSLEPLELRSHDVESRSLYVDRLFQDVFGAPDDEYSLHASRSLLLAAVWRAFAPGTKHDEILVLQGRQGIGKDAILSTLMPDPQMFTTSFSFSMNTKSKVEATRGKVLVIASEMGGVTTTNDLEQLKQYITADHDDLRLAYRRDAEYIPRRFVMACTTNLDKPLPSDPSGNRRFVVVRLGPSLVGAVEPFVAGRRDRMWRECVALYRAGMGAELPRELKSLQATQNEGYERVDEQAEAAFDDAVANGLIKDDKPYTLSEIGVKMQFADDQAAFNRMGREVQHRVRNELLRRGWENRRMRRTPHRVERVWFKE